MLKQHIIHRMLMDEIIAFKKVGINPNTIVMSSNILYHMLQWEDAIEYHFIPENVSQTRATYYGLYLVEAQPVPTDDKTRTPGVCFVCCAASSGKLKNIFID